MTALRQSQLTLLPVTRAHCRSPAGRSSVACSCTLNLDNCGYSEVETSSIYLSTNYLQHAELIVFIFYDYLISMHNMHIDPARDSSSVIVSV